MAANLNVLVAIPAKAEMHPALAERMHSLSTALVDNNPGFNVELCIFTEQFQKTPGVASIFDRPARARNALIEKYLRPGHDLVMWIDADLVQYTPDMILRLHAANPGGVTAPLVLIEPTGAPQDNWFYDVAAFIEHGQPVHRRGPHFGNVSHRPPYFVSPANVIPCDSVGCCYLIPAAVHRSGVQFVPTPFTDHFPVIQQARAMDLPVVTARYIVAAHAFLPKYGEAWHGEPMAPWQSFDFATYGLVVDDGEHGDRDRQLDAAAKARRRGAAGKPQGAAAARKNRFHR